LTSVTLPNSLTTIGNGAFSGCSDLTEIVNYRKTPHIIGEYVFNDVSRANCTLWVPAGSVDAYRAANGWMSFRKMGIIGNPGSITTVDPSGVTGSLKWALNYDDGILTIGGTGAMPDYLYYYNEPQLPPWYEHLMNITGVIIGDGVSAIGNEAFSGCSKMTSVVIGNSVTVIGYSAFSSCSSLASVTIPNSVTDIGAGAFSDCSSLSSVTIGSSVTNIGGSAFRHCGSLTEIVNYQKIPQKIQISVYMGVSDHPFAFVDIANCTLLVPAGSVEEYCWADVWKIFGKIGAIGDPSSIVTGCYCNCSTEEMSGTTGELTWTLSSHCTLTISGTGAMPDYSVFINMRGGSDIVYTPWAQLSVASVVIEDGVTSIGDNAFRGCNILRSITIPNSVTSIGGNAFMNCTGLTSITIPNTVKSIGDNAFWSCSGLTSVTIPNSVTSIGYSAFRYCRTVKSASVPNSVTFIGSQAFYECSSLVSINVDNGNTVYSSENGVLFNKTKSTLIQYPAAKLGAYIIPNSVTDIDYYAFQGCTGLTSITISNSITKIGERTFEWCTGLTSVTIPNSVTEIGSLAFSGCTGLTSVTIPNSVKSIGNGVFRNCTGLTSVTIGNSLAYIGEGMFQHCSGLTSISIPNTVTSIGGGAFWGCSGLKNVTIPNTVTFIGFHAFFECSGLTEIINRREIPQTIPETIYINPESAFDGVNKSKCTLFVPAGSEAAYRIAKGWRAFEKIKLIQ